MNFLILLLHALILYFWICDIYLCNDLAGICWKKLILLFGCTYVLLNVGVMFSAGELYIKTNIVIEIF